MFNNYASIMTKWTDTTSMDNLHASAVIHDGLPIAGSKEWTISQCARTYKLFFLTLA